jgi:hypothetical protein
MRLGHQWTGQFSFCEIQQRRPLEAIVSIQRQSEAPSVADLPESMDEEDGNSTLVVKIA